MHIPESARTLCRAEPSALPPGQFYAGLPGGLYSAGDAVSPTAKTTLPPGQFGAGQVVTWLQCRRCRLTNCLCLVKFGMAWSRGGLSSCSRPPRPHSRLETRYVVASAVCAPYTNNAIADCMLVGARIDLGKSKHSRLDVHEMCL